MFKKEVTYTNFEDQEITETCWFSLSEADILELQLAPKEGLQEYMEHIMAEIDDHRTEVLAFIKQVLLKAYGVRREIGGKAIFTKTADDLLIFQYSGAFDAVYTELLKHPEEIYTFMRLAAPSKYRESLAEAEREGKLPTREQIENDPQKALALVTNAENSNS